MREIKFRAWDKETNKMYRVGSIHFHNMGYGIKVFNKPYPEERHWQPQDTFELLQYIGLKDRKGVEIFEGDIVEYKFNELVEFHHGQKVEPKWNITRMEVGFTNGCFHIGHYCKNTLDKNYYQYPEMVEVIGNIYSDKYLLDNS